jgi:PIN like domain
MHEFCKGRGDEVDYLRHKFDESTPDVDWLGQLGTEGGWIVISADVRITKHKSPERAAWRTSGLTAFFFHKAFAQDGFWNQVHTVVRRWPDISAQAKRTPRAKGFLIPKSGDFTPLEP